MPRARRETEVPVSSIAADQHQQDREDPRPDRAEQVLEPGLDPVADLAAFPAEEEDEDR